MILCGGKRQGKLIAWTKQAVWEAHERYRVVESYKGEQLDQFMAALASLGECTRHVRMLLTKLTGRQEDDLTESTLRIVADPLLLETSVDLLTSDNTK